MLTKKLRFDDDVLKVIASMEWENDGKLGIMTSGQLDRKLYVSVNKALEAMGGKWSKKDKGHVFEDDPRLNVEGLLNDGVLEVDRDGFFRTPDMVIDRMFELVPVNKDAFILEPSAGDGAIIKRLIEEGVDYDNIVAVELNEKRSRIIEEIYDVSTYCEDFLLWVVPYSVDLIYMNPPFENLQDIDHVQHAYNFLNPGGTLVSVMSESPFFRKNKKSRDFRDWLDEVNGRTELLCKGSFLSSGTMVNSRLVIIEK